MFKRLLTALCLIVAPALALEAQVVETPEAFDAAGRVMAITPSMAAHLQLLPPAWRITGDYNDARLFRLGNEGYVLVVTRRNGVVERYAISNEEREYLRERTANLPPRVQEQLREGLARAGRNAAAQTRNNAFIRNQTVLGLTVYGPSFAAAISDDGAGQSAAYLLVAGGTFFAASTLAREYQITPAQNNLATWGAIGGALAGWGAVYTLDGSNDAKAAAIFAGGLGGTAAGLGFGKDMTESEVTAALFTATAAPLVVAGFMNSFSDTDAGANTRTKVGAAVVASLAGYPLGMLYTRNAPYNVTSGDVYTLWATGLLTANTVAIPLLNSSVSDGTASAIVSAGFLAGIVAGDRLIVRRFDYERGDGALLGLGTLAGALMGSGMYALVDREGRNDQLSAGLASAGGVAGLLVSHYYLSPRDDADLRRVGSRVHFEPSGALMAAARVPGAHPILSLTF